MARPCHVCQSSDRPAIELGLAQRVKLRLLEKKFGISRSSLSNHRCQHMPDKLVATLRTMGKRPSEIDLEALRRNLSEGLLQHAAAQQGRLLVLLDRALDEGDLRAAAQVEDRITGNLTFVGKLLGEVNGAARTQINNILIAPAYVELRLALSRALRKHPEAARDVAGALREVEERHAPKLPQLPQVIEGEAHAVAG